jgi:anti-sigma B factor antagonist
MHLQPHQGTGVPSRAILNRITVDGIPVVSVYGDIDISNAVDVEKGLRDAVLPAAPGLVIELTNVGYFSSATLRILMELHEEMTTRGGQLRVVMAEDAPMRRVLLLTKLDRLIPLHSTVDAAVSSIMHRPHEPRS